MIARLLLFLIAVQFIHSKEIDFDPIPEENSSSSGTAPNHPYIGLPITTWTIIRLNATEKKNVCNEQISFCRDQCYGNDYTEKNFCDTTTMAWGCSCKDQVPIVPPYHWPVAVAECRGKELSCVNGCSDGMIKDLCSQACSRYYRCDQAGSPPSGLKVDEEGKMPVYQVPVSSGSLTSLSFLCFMSVFVNLYVYM